MTRLAPVRSISSAKGVAQDVGDRLWCPGHRGDHGRPRPVRPGWLQTAPRDPTGVGVQAEPLSDLLGVKAGGWEPAVGAARPRS